MARILEARGLLFDELRDVKEAVAQLHRSLRDRRPARGPAENTREAIDLILDHLDRHGSSPGGHAIALPPEKGGGVRLGTRTNVRHLSFFHEMKHGERRRSGRPGFRTTPCRRSPRLLKPDDVTLPCGTVDRLPQAFAQLDANRDCQRLAPQG